MTSATMNALSTRCNNKFTLQFYFLLLLEWLKKPLFKMASSEQQLLRCKQDAQHLQIVLGQLTTDMSCTGPLTQDYLDELGRDLGHEWRLLADQLGISKARVQAIIRQHVGDQYPEHMIKDMLQSWFKNTPKNGDKVSSEKWTSTSSRKIFMI